MIFPFWEHTRNIGRRCTQILLDSTFMSQIVKVTESETLSSYRVPGKTPGMRCVGGQEVWGGGVGT